jgi:hypothetical protein
MVASGVQRNPQSHRQFSGGKWLIPLQLGQHGAALALVAHRELGVDLRKRGAHRANVK